jgi:CHAD domain-containing protein
MTGGHLILTAAGRPTADVVDALEAHFATASTGTTTGHVTYFDTFDCRLHAAGLALRREEGDVLVLATLDGGTLVRCLASDDPAFAPDLPDGPVRYRIARLVDVRRLLPIAHVDRTVRTVSVLDTEDKTVVRVRHENGTVRNGDGRGVLPAVVRVTPVKGYDGPLQRVIGVLERDLDLERTSLDEVALITGALGRTIVPRKRTIELDPERPAEEALRKVLTRLLEVMRENEPGMRERLDSEFLHDYRVAVRRIRSALSQVKGVLPADDSARFREEFKWLGRVTGPARDADVFLLMLPEYEASLPEEARGNLGALKTLLAQHQREAYGALIAALDSDRYRALIRDWSDRLRRPVAETPSAPNALRAVRPVVSKRIRKVARGILRDGEAIDDSTPAAALHELRIECKKLRYLLDLFAGLYDREEIKIVTRELKKLQDNLGRFNDCELQQQWLTDCAREMAATDPTPVDTFLAMGRLESSLQAGQTKERQRFTKRFARFAGAENRRRLERLFSEGGRR